MKLVTTSFWNLESMITLTGIATPILKLSLYFSCKVMESSGLGVGVGVAGTSVGVGVEVAVGVAVGADVTVGVGSVVLLSSLHATRQSISDRNVAITITAWKMDFFISFS